MGRPTGRLRRIETFDAEVTMMNLSWSEKAAAVEAIRAHWTNATRFNFVAGTVEVNGFEESIEEALLALEMLAEVKVAAEAVAA